MFNKLKQRWQVNGINLVLIICTFALGGSICGIAGRKILGLTEINDRILFILLYIIVVSFLWPFCVLLVSIPLGQFSFFTTYLSRLWKRISHHKKPALSVAIFASGAGSNAEKIIEHSILAGKTGTCHFRVDLIVCNKPGAGVLKVAVDYNIDTLLIDKERFFRGGYTTALKARGIQFIVLAGFLWKVPISLIREYPNMMINIHPALLPKYGGKGMYGDKVHAAVIAAAEIESGITIHYVDELYDHGNIIFQARCPVHENDTPLTLAKKIHLLEHKHYPEIIEGLAQKVK